MIAKSDIIILTVSSAILAVALTRSMGSEQRDASATAASRTISSSLAATQAGSDSGAGNSAASAAGDALTARLPPTTLTPGQLGKSTTLSQQNSGQFDSQSNSTGINTTASTNSASTASAGQTAVGSSTNTSAASTQDSGPEYATYVVRSGDSLSKIANRFGTTVAELQAVNELTSTRILVGQTLSYPQR